MTGPRRIQRKRTKGWRLPEGAVYVGRPTRWGNPFTVGQQARVYVTGADGLAYDGCRITLTPTLAVELYRDELTGLLRPFDEPHLEHPDDLARWSERRAALAELAGRDLCCWCPLDQPCHADVLLEIANRA